MNISKYWCLTFILAANWLISNVHADLFYLTDYLSVIHYDTQEVTFTMVFNQPPDFYTLDEHGRQKYSFQYYIDDNSGGPSGYADTIIRGGEIHIDGDVRIRDRVGGAILGSVPYTLIGTTVEFTAPWYMLQTSDGEFTYSLDLLSYGGHIVSYEGISGQGVYGYGGGSGTLEDPYLIYTTDHLNQLSIRLADISKHYKLMADIDLFGEPGTQFNTIDLTGSFDGNGHTISNLADRSLFGFVRQGIGGSPPVIKNLGLVNPIGEGHFVIYLFEASLSRCYVTSNRISSPRGAFVDYAESSNISQCYVKCDIVGDNTTTGGLLGVADRVSISNCYVIGNVSGNYDVGGIAGYLFGSMNNCYFSGNVTGTEWVGAICGAHDSEGGEINSVFWDNTVCTSVSRDVGGPYWDGPWIYDLPTELMMQRATYDWDFINIWQICEGTSYPHFAWEVLDCQKYSGGDGSEADPYRIATADDLQEIGANPDDWDWNKHFLQTADIDLTAYTGTQFNLIGYYEGPGDPDNNPFHGTFDGNGYTISNFTYTCTGQNKIGLFRFGGGQIKNVRLVSPQVDAGNGDHVGALVGDYGGYTMSGCSVEGGYVSGDDHVGGLIGSLVESDIEDIHAHCLVTGDNYVGGIVGEMWGMSSYISNCRFDGTIVGGNDVGGIVGYSEDGDLFDCYSSGKVEGSDSIGGVVGGQTEARILRCGATAEVEGTYNVGGLVGKIFVPYMFQESYAKGNVTGQQYVGGLIGYASMHGVYDCYSTGDVTGQSDVGGLIGKVAEFWVNYCYSRGQVIGTTNVGGLLGSHSYVAFGSSSSIWNNTLNPDITGVGNQTPDPDGVNGKSTYQMVQKETYVNAGWDFVNIWDICDGSNYPRLAWQEPIPGDFVCPDGVNLQDFTIIAEEWLMTGAELVSDIYPAGGNGIVDLYDLNLFCQNWLTDVFNPFAGFRHIHRGTVIVDGDLSEWSSHPMWIDLDQIYNGDPADVTDAKVALRWDPDTNKVYAAVVVTDADHIFTDDYITWDASDRIEIYTQGSAAGGTGFYGNYGTAQQYMVGPDTTGGSWGTWALGQTIDPNANFEYAVQIVGNQIIYEIGITQYDYYGGFAGGDSILTALYPGRTIGLDIIASSRHAAGFGMRSENLMTGKYLDADQFAQYMLVE